MFFEIAEISDPLHFCVGVVLKEAKEEYLLIGQLLCVMLSAYTNNPLNIAVNSPPGEGKSYVIHKVAEKFPKEDVIFLAGMTDKALFHRSGVLVVKNENGEYEYVEDKLDSIEFQIEDKESEIARSRDSTLQKTLKHQIKQLEKEKGDLLKIARKLIDLDHKILIFTDTPRTELLSALLPLLSHDKHKVEREYVYTHDGIRTRNNILRGWPAVILAQSVNYSSHPRWPEIQRRFLITNPKMTTEKYRKAVALIGDKYGLPDLVYQQKVVSSNEKKSSLRNY